MSTNTDITPDTTYAHDAHGDIVTIGTMTGGGISPAGVPEWVYRMERDGHAVTYVPTLQPYAHRVSGAGMQHDDAAFCERRDGSGSMAAYYENGEAFGGRWWEDTDGAGMSIGVKHFGCADRSGRKFSTRRDVASQRLAEMGGAA